jgi:hypothetical protein
MRYLLLLVFLFPSCSLYETLRTNAAKVEEVLGKTQAVVETGIAKYETAKAEADTDKDGTVSLTELLAYLAGTVGLGGITVAARNSKSNERKAKAEAKLDAIERRLSTLP